MVLFADFGQTGREEKCHWQYSLEHVLAGWPYSVTCSLERVNSRKVRGLEKQCNKHTTTNSMRSPVSIHRKAAKSQARRKDYERRKNTNDNVPTMKVELRKEVFANKTRTTQAKPYRTGRHGRTRQTNVVVGGLAERLHVGYKTVIEKMPICKLHVKGNVHKPRIDAQNRLTPMVEYPPSRKFKKTTKK